MARPQAEVRIVVADDHVPTRMGIRAVLEANGFIVCAEAFHGPSAVEAALRERPDVCLIDVSMPGGDGIAAAAEITARLPDTKVVMITASEGDESLFASLKAGASGYVLKGAREEELPRTLQQVLQGEGGLSPNLVPRLIQEFRQRDRPSRLHGRITRGSSQLTEREWEVLELLGNDLSTREIAERLSISPVSVRTHIGRILKKLRVSDREAAVKLFNSEG